MVSRCPRLLEDFALLLAQIVQPHQL